MRALELTALYLLLGLGVAAVALLRARAGGWIDAGLLLVFWPLYGPVVLMGARPATSGSPALALGDGLESRLRALDAQVEALDQLLLQPDFHIEDARARRQAHLDKGELRAAARVEARIGSIERLRARRAALLEGLAEARELRAQLRVQAEVLRVTGGSQDETWALVQELECRVEGLFEAETVASDAQDRVARGDSPEPASGQAFAEEI